MRCQQEQKRDIGIRSYHCKLMVGGIHIILFRLQREKDEHYDRIP